MVVPQPAIAFLVQARLKGGPHLLIGAADARHLMPKSLFGEIVIEPRQVDGDPIGVTSARGKIAK